MRVAISLRNATCAIRCGESASGFWRRSATARLRNWPRTRRRRRRRSARPSCTRSCSADLQVRERDTMTIKLPIYMDYHATTPVDPRVVEAMMPYFTEHFGTAASRNHPFGWEAEEAVEKARKQIADLIGANAKEIVFTSGATESDNLAIKGVAEMYREKGNHIITCVTEHKAVIDTCKRLEKDGYRVTYLPVQKDGRISLDELKAAIADKTILITIMAANNEIGGFGKAAEICKQEMATESERLRGLRDYLNDKLHKQLDELYINGSMEHRLPHNLNISFAYVEGESLLMGINDVAVSSGSACTSATLEPSYVLKALGTGDDLAHSSIRFGIGRFNTEAEIDYVADRVVETVQRLRELSPLYEMAKEGVDLKQVKWAAE